MSRNLENSSLTPELSDKKKKKSKFSFIEKSARWLGAMGYPFAGMFGGVPQNSGEIDQAALADMSRRSAVMQYVEENGDDILSIVESSRQVEEQQIGTFHPTTTARIREFANVNAEQLSTATAGSEYRVIGESYNDLEGFTWYKIIYSGGVGWVREDTGTIVRGTPEANTDETTRINVDGSPFNLIEPSGEILPLNTESSEITYIQGLLEKTNVSLAMVEEMALILYGEGEFVGYDLDSYALVYLTESGEKHLYFPGMGNVGSSDTNQSGSPDTQSAPVSPEKLLQSNLENGFIYEPYIFSYTKDNKTIKIVLLTSKKYQYGERTPRIVLPDQIALNAEATDAVWGNVLITFPELNGSTFIIPIIPDLVKVDTSLSTPVADPNLDASYLSGSEEIDETTFIFVSARSVPKGKEEDKIERVKYLSRFAAGIFTEIAITQGEDQFFAFDLLTAIYNDLTSINRDPNVNGEDAYYGLFDFEDQVSSHISLAD